MKIIMKMLHFLSQSSRDANVAESQPKKHRRAGRGLPGCNKNPSVSDTQKHATAPDSGTFESPPQKVNA